MKTMLSRPMGRFFYWPLIVGLALLPGMRTWAVTSPQKTVVQDTLYKADGTYAAGTVVISWGESQLSKSANNYFGIKAHGKHPVMEFRTREFDHASEHEVVARFAVYESMQECFECRDRMIANGAAYAAARAAKGDVEQFAREMGRHWATDPKYAEKLLEVYRECGLDKQC